MNIALRGKGPKRAAFITGEYMPRKLLAAMAATGLCVAASSQALAQDATAATHGGDVTADEATPLPPIVVQSPSEPIRRKARRTASTTPSGTPGVVFDDGEAFEGTSTDGPSVGAFTLGQLDSIGGSTITNDAIYTFNTQSLDQAVNLLPGVTMHNTGGSRAERDIYVRGFDRLRVPLYMDGVRINLPYDNRLDMSRFLTPDLAEIQVQKGYVSVLNGPGGMGGAINLVSRKPTKEVELEGRVGLVTNGDLDDTNQWSSYAYAGTRQKGWYAQLSGTIVDRDQFNLSNDFRPAGPSTVGYLPYYPYEDGGDRDNSAFQDWRINAKIGITPNATDEYSINYTYQQSEKDAPLHTHRQIVQGYQQNRARFWQWPQWDISTLSWMSKTQLGEASYVKTNAYYNTFDNALRFNTFNYAARITDSVYSDHSYGGFVEMGTQLIPMNTLKGAIHYRRDVHDAWNENYDIASGAFTGRTATETDSEETWSFAVENTFHATRALDIVAGVSYDYNEVLRSDGTAFPLPDLGKWSWQGAAIYSYSRDGKVHANVSSRVRFPTLFDRYSNRFGSRSEEPFLNAERATNYEIGISDRLFNTVSVSSAVFYSDIQDTIQTAFTQANGNNSLVVYNADGDSYGFELSVDWDVSPVLRIGGNYTYLERDLNFGSAAAAYTSPTGNVPAAQLAIAASQLDGTPRHSLFLYAAWRPMSQLTLTPSLIVASDRPALVTSCASSLVANGGAPTPGTPGEENMQNGGCGNASGFTGTPSYKKLGAHALVNFQAEYEFNDNASMAVGVTNLFDQNYSLAEGFPEPGRQFYANARVRF